MSSKVTSTVPAKRSRSSSIEIEEDFINLADSPRSSFRRRSRSPSVIVEAHFKNENPQENVKIPAPTPILRPRKKRVTYHYHPVRNDEYLVEEEVEFLGHSGDTNEANGADLISPERVRNDVNFFQHKRPKMKVEQNDPFKALKRASDLIKNVGSKFSNRQTFVSTMLALILLAFALLHLLRTEETSRTLEIEIAEMANLKQEIQEMKATIESNRIEILALRESNNWISDQLENNQNLIAGGQVLIPQNINDQENGHENGVLIDENANEVFDLIHF